jgi:hypothetical protein
MQAIDRHMIVEISGFRMTVAASDDFKRLTDEILILIQSNESRDLQDGDSSTPLSSHDAIQHSFRFARSDFVPSAIINWKT